ncbi:MAG: hypothetical protein SPF56_07260 [Bacteroidaceae bacterium]|nr:hypothetical protein [Bacteroidaceae bacterium]
MSYKNFNLDILNNRISTQYNDMKGIVAIDGHNFSDLWKLCTDNGVDLNDWFLVGLECYDFEPLGRQDIHAMAYVIRKEELETEHDALASRLENTNDAEIHIKRFTVPYSQLAGYIKRIHIGLVSDLSSKMGNVTFVEDENE